MTNEKYILNRIEEARREIMRLLASVEHGSDYAYQLDSILENAVDELEALYEDAHEAICA